MKIEVPFVADAKVKDAKVTCGEFPEVGSLNIISRGSHLDVDFEWTQDGSLWEVVQGNWVIEALFEQIGGAETNVNPKANIPHAQKKVNTYKGTLHVDNLPKGGIFKVYAKLHFEINGVLLVCGFQETCAIHIME